MAWQREGSFAFLPLSGDFSSTGIKTEQIELQQLGYYLLKVHRNFLRGPFEVEYYLLLDNLSLTSLPEWPPSQFDKIQCIYSLSGALMFYEVKCILENSFSF